MIIKNIFGDKRKLKYKNLYNIFAGVYNGEVINSNSSKKAIKKYLKIHPKTKNIVDAEKIEFNKGWDVNKVIEV